MPGPICESTQKIYKNIIERLGKYNQEWDSVPKIVERSADVIAYLLATYPNKQTLKGRLSAVLRSIRDDPGFQAEQLVPWSKAFNDCRGFTDAIAVSQTLPETKLENMLSWPEVLALKGKARETLTVEDYLIYCLYTLNAPVRADYTGMIVTKTLSPNMTRDTTRNYCVVHKTESFFIFNVFKTAKSHGRQTVNASDELHHLLATVTTPTLLKLSTPASLVQAIIRIFTALSGKKMGINLLRHSYITHFLSTPRSIKEKAEVARRMLNSVQIQEKYHIFPVVEEDPEDTQPEVDVNVSSC